MNRIAAQDAGGDGIRLQLEESKVSEVRVSGAGDDGLRLEGTSITTLDRVQIADCDGDGVSVGFGQLQRHVGEPRVSNNGGSGIVLSVTIICSRSRSAPTRGRRRADRRDPRVLMHTTSANNGSSGIVAGPAPIRRDRQLREHEQHLRLR